MCNSAFETATRNAVQTEK